MRRYCWIYSAPIPISISIPIPKLSSLFVVVFLSTCHLPHCQFAAQRQRISSVCDSHTIINKFACVASAVIAFLSTFVLFMKYQALINNVNLFGLVSDSQIYHIYRPVCVWVYSTPYLSDYKPAISARLWYIALQINRANSIVARRGEASRVCTSIPHKLRLTTYCRRIMTNDLCRGY